jgi:hypothetical protein
MKSQKNSHPQNSHTPQTTHKSAGLSAQRNETRLSTHVLPNLPEEYLRKILRGLPFDLILEDVLELGTVHDYQRFLGDAAKIHSAIGGCGYNIRITATNNKLTWICTPIKPISSHEHESLDHSTFPPRRVSNASGSLPTTHSTKSPCQLDSANHVSQSGK